MTLERAYERGFLLRSAPPPPPGRTRLPVPPHRSVLRPGARISLGDPIGPERGSRGRLGPILAIGGHRWAFSAGHLFSATGEEVYRGDQVVGTVVGLIRPDRDPEFLDAALIELVAEVTWPLRCGASWRAPGHRGARRGEIVELAAGGWCTRGRVLSVSEVARMRGAAGDYMLFGQLALAGLFSAMGDSGCAVLGEDGQYLGLLVGGEEGVAVATPIATLLAAFDLEGATWSAPAPRVPTRQTDAPPPDRLAAPPSVPRLRPPP